MIDRYKVTRVVEFTFMIETGCGVEGALEEAIKISTEKPLTGETLSVSIEKAQGNNLRSKVD